MMAIYIHLQSSSLPLFAASFSFQQQQDCTYRSAGSSEEPGLLPATARIRLKFFSTVVPTSLVVQQQEQERHLFLLRRERIELYGREIVHTSLDAKAATMSLWNNERDEDESMMWDATLVLRPNDTEISDNAVTNTNTNTTRLLLAPPMQGEPKSSFVAMNRFHVKEDCKPLFEERWSQRQSKLPHQPGFVGFSLLRKTNCAKQQEMQEQAQYDRFNYSTCTIWDSIDSWNRWRKGTGKMSHEASRDPSQEKRIPVSEWLEGPSSPIFWDGTISLAKCHTSIGIQ